MKVILGVDLQELYLPALHLLSRLGLKDVELSLVQTAPTIESILPQYPMDGATLDLVQGTLKKAGEEALAAAKEAAKTLGFKASGMFCLGPSGEMLNETVEAERAELVALRTNHLGTWRSEFLGSVTRAVVLGSRVSTLVAKKEPKPGTTLNLVFAADGSEFNSLCVERFARLNPSKVGTIHVVTAWGISTPFENLIRHAFHHSPGVEKEMNAVAESAAGEVVKQLIAAGFNAVARVDRGTPDEVLANAMKTTNADLMVVGAHGKNWVERLLIGSTSLHQVIGEPYNVLVLRP